MKRTILVGLLAVGMLSQSAWAQDLRPQVEEVRRAQTLVKIAQDQLKQRIETGTYLGIASSPVPAALREQLKLKRGVGLVVERVEKESPAEQAGVRQYDIVEKLDEQILMNSEQFAGLVRMQGAGAQVKLSIIRQGEPQIVTVTLVEKKMPADVLLWNNGKLLGDLNGKVVIKSPSMSDFKFSGPIDPKTRMPREMTITSAVGQKVLTITRNGDSTHLYAKDPSGMELFDGDVNTEEQWKEVPPDVAAEARRLIGGDGKAPFLKRLFINPPEDGDKATTNLPPVEPVPAKPPQPALP